jgi:hypothetical protein
MIITLLLFQGCTSTSCYLRLQASGYDDQIDYLNHDGKLNTKRDIRTRRDDTTSHIDDRKTSHRSEPIDDGPLLRMMYPVYHFLTPIKRASLASHPLIILDGFKALSDRVIEFCVRVNVTSPFLWMEYDPSQIRGVGDGSGSDDSSDGDGSGSDNKSNSIHSGDTDRHGDGGDDPNNNDIRKRSRRTGSQEPSPYANIHNVSAGWFSDNNFLAEAHTYYTITYTSYSHNLPSIGTFKQALNVRVLQQVNT